MVTPPEAVAGDRHVSIDAVRGFADGAGEAVGEGHHFFGGVDGEVEEVVGVFDGDDEGVARSDGSDG